MPIPEDQLETWSHQGSIQQSSETYNAVRNVLTKSSTPFAGRNFQVYLQGSYGNDTNIYSESDVDIVIQLDSCFFSDVESLSDLEKVAHKEAFVSASYTHVDFKNDVLSSIRENFGSAVSLGDKAISIDASGGRRKTDVIVATQFRRYFKFKTDYESDYAEGICFFNANGERVANYPKQHSANLTVKHQGNSQLLKPMIRIFKNMRNRLEEVGLLKNRIAPSYYIECLLYNVPIGKMVGSYQESVVNVLNWYQSEASKFDLLCANEQYYLLRTGFHTCWPQQDCDDFISSAIELWQRW